MHNRIAMLRGELAVSRQQLADAVEANVQTIGSIERGDSAPGLELAMKIAGVFGVPVTAVFSLTPFEPIAQRLERSGSH